MGFLKGHEVLLGGISAVQGLPSLALDRAEGLVVYPL